VRLIAVVVGSALFVALLPVLGMTLATALFLLGICSFPGAPHLGDGLGAASSPLGNWAIFAWWLQVPFPTGVLGF
jgi:hypothetical protein